MPIPPDHQMVGPAVGGPFTSIECPSDGARAAANDIRRPVAALLANDKILFGSYLDQYDVSVDLVDPDFEIELFNSNSFTDSAVFLIDVPSALADEDLCFAFTTTGNRANTTSGFSYVRIVVVEDVGGANTLRVPSGARTAIGGGSIWLPTAIYGRHRVITAGAARVKVQVRSVGGDDTIFAFAGRLDVTRIRRKVF